jgi:hypothetical protein
MIIHAFTISAFGHCASKQEYDSRKLAGKGLDHISWFLSNHGADFCLTIHLKGVGDVEVRMTAEHPSSGTASFLAGGELLATNVMVSGINGDADKRALEMGQVALRKVCEAAGQEPPGEDLIRILERPAVASLRWSTRDRQTLDLLADLEICVAAAFFDRAFRTMGQTHLSA